MKLKKWTASLFLAGALMMSLPAGAQEGVHIEINGVPVVSSANHIAAGKAYVDVAAYTKLVGAQFTFDEKKKKVKVNGKTLNARVIDGIPTVPVKDLMKATGGDKLTWDEKTKTAYVLDLPEGTVQISPSVPGMGEHWANPQELPLGPIYGVEDGKLVFLEQMIDHAALVEGKSWTNILGMKGLPSPAVDHTDIEFQPNGHEGFEVPHYDIHHYFVTHEEHLKFGMSGENHEH